MEDYYSKEILQKLDLTGVEKSSKLLILKSPALVSSDAGVFYG